jgi:hypothetical protein
MAKQFELNRTKQLLRRKEKELRDAQDVSAQWLADLRSKFSVAQELGLIPRLESEISRDQMIELLEEVITRTDLTLAVSTTTISDALSELSNLESEEREVSRDITTLRHRLEEMNRIRVGVQQYDAALSVQRGRLQLSRWLVSHSRDESDCPMCGSHTDSAKRKLQNLSLRLEEVEKALGADKNKEVPAAFDRELQRVTTDVGNATERLRAVQIRKKALTGRSKEASEQQFSVKRTERFIGNLESSLVLHRKLGSDSEIVEDVRALKEAVITLEGELRGQDVDARKRRALRTINTNAGKLLPDLDIENPNDPISLEINDLTIKVLGSERDDYLSEIGSGSNWLSYHLAVLLSLHQFYLSQKNSPVPGFLVLDQPSQVYFPRHVVSKDIDIEDDPKVRDEDVDAVRKAFEVMGRVVRSEKGKLQLIVLDHASSEVWGGIDGVIGLPEWRGLTKLVPMEWISEA